MVNRVSMWNGVFVAPPFPYYIHCEWLKLTEYHRYWFDPRPPLLAIGHKAQTTACCLPKLGGKALPLNGSLFYSTRPNWISFHSFSPQGFLQTRGWKLNKSNWPNIRTELCCLLACLSAALDGGRSIVGYRTWPKTCIIRLTRVTWPPPPKFSGNNKGGGGKGGAGPLEWLTIYLLL